MFSLRNFSAGLPFPANAWLGMQAAQGPGQVCSQLNPGQWGFQPPNNNATWGGATTNIHFWGNQGLPQMAQSPAQQVLNQPLAILTYPAQPTSAQPYLYMHSLARCTNPNRTTQTAALLSSPR